jgi:hypothetical protein
MKRKKGEQIYRANRHFSHPAGKLVSFANQRTAPVGAFCRRNKKAWTEEAEDARIGGRS